MMSETHAKFLRHAIDLAQQARKRGNHPFGAIIVLPDGAVIAAENTVVTGADCTCHAEVNAIRSGLRGRANLDHGTMYASTEPCAMCAGAIDWAGLSRIVFACSAVKLGEFTGGSLLVPCRDVLAKGRRSIEVIGPALEDVAAKVHEGFWSRPSVHGSPLPC